MSWRARERRRKKRLALRRDKSTARKSGSSKRAWYLTLASSKTCCARISCRRILGVGSEIVYRHEPMEILCVPCADREQVPYRPSVRWERSRKVHVRHGPSWMRDDSL